MNLQTTEFCRVRAITAFTTLQADHNTWEATLSEAKQQCDNLAAAFQQTGYRVQSIRIVTNPFGEYLNTDTLAAAKQGLSHIQEILTRINQNGLRIRFAVGEARSAEEIALLPELIKDYGDLCNACVNIETDNNGFLNDALIHQCTAAIQQIGRITPRGEGNFNFTVNFNCAPLIPYFPASYHRSQAGNVLVVGLETPDLLAAALRNLNNLPAERPAYYHTAFQAMSAALQYHVDQINASIANGYQGLFKPKFGLSSRTPGRDVNHISQPDKKIPAGFRGAK